MRNCGLHPSQMGWLLLLCATAFLSSGTALAQVTHYVVIQPIDVCSTSGPSGGCAPFNNLTQSPDPSKTTSTTPIGFVDSTTNVNVTRAIWLQAGIDVTFLPMAEYNNSNYQSLPVTCTTTPNPTCTGNVTSSTGTFNFQLLSSGKATKATGCKSNCSVPLAPAAANAINMFFVNSLVPGAGVGGPLFGFAWLNGNGIVVASNTFFPTTLGATPRWDTLAHEIGHNLNLDHTTFGAGTANNAMTGGGIRTIASSTGCSSTTSPGGELFGLATGNCAVQLATLDQLILGNSTNIQQAQALLSGLMNPIPNVSATAGGGAAAAATATATATMTTTAAATTDPAINFTVTFPKIKQAGGRAGEYIFALVIALPQGFQFGTPGFTYAPGQIPQVYSFEFLNGNNGQGNTNCLKPINGAPAIQCLEIDFVAGTFTANTSFSFTSNIINKSTGQTARLADLACSLPNPLQCLDLTYVFSDLLAISSAFDFRDNTGNLSANSQLPDQGVQSAIVDPASFPSVANLNPPLSLKGFTQIPCTLAGTSTSCPPPTKGGSPTSNNYD
jgi:hypothetical protein